MRLAVLVVTEVRTQLRLLPVRSTLVAAALVEMVLQPAQLVVTAVMVEAVLSLFVMRAPCLRVHQLNHALVHTLLSDSKPSPNAHGMFPLE